MLVKIFGSLLLLGFFYIQLSNSLECYSCNSQLSCKSPGKVTCNKNNADDTWWHLSHNFVGNITNMTSSNFNCMFQNFTSPYANLTYKGCIYDKIDVCNLAPKNGNLKRVKCLKCSSKLCNSVGTISSSVLTVLASVVAVAIYKVLNV